MIFTSKRHGKVEVISDGEKRGYWRVRFLNTGHEDEFRKDAVLHGEIRDKYAVTLCGVGIIGDIKTRGKYKPYYTLWRNMITRCYNTNNPAYHGRVSVCERWHTFQNFYQDVPKIDGWNKAAFETGMLVLDKDIKQRFCAQKIYSIDTCTWTTQSVNSPIQDKQQRRFEAISPSGERLVDTNISKFAREHGLERRSISSVLHGRFKSTFGWQFKYIDEEIV